MEQIVLVIHLVIALAIIGLIMLQQGKGADMGASFGAGGSQTIFGSDGSGNVLTRATSWLVVLFFASSFGLAVLANQRSVTVDDLNLDIPGATSPVVTEISADEFEAATEAAASQGDEIPVMESDLPAPILTEGDVPEL